MFSSGCSMHDQIRAATSRNASAPTYMSHTPARTVARRLSDRAGMILGMTAQRATDVILEIGRKRVFACAAAWPGWCRSGRSGELALETLPAYLPRYAQVARRAGLGLPRP